jgi:hypothetical protein
VRAFIFGSLQIVLGVTMYLMIYAGGGVDWPWLLSRGSAMTTRTTLVGIAGFAAAFVVLSYLNIQDSHRNREYKFLKLEKEFNELQQASKMLDERLERLQEQAQESEEQVDRYAALLMVKCYGDDAMLEASMRADQLMEEGDMAGAEVWHRILNAIERLQATEPADDEVVH